MNKFFSNSEDYGKMSADSKIGLVATIDPEGYPHVTFLSSIQPLGEDMMTFGQFTEGLSKQFMTERTRAGFLIFTPALEYWTGAMDYEKTEISGPEFDIYNKKPLFRYNSYFGIGKVHYFKLKDLSPKSTVTMLKIVGGALKTRAKALAQKESGKEILNPIAKGMLNEIDGLKFISYVDNDGYPRLVPIIQAAPAGTDRIVFDGAKKDAAASLPEGKASIFFTSLKMESLLAKGSFRRKGNMGIFDIEKLYNPMQPLPKYIYPAEPIKKIVQFE